MEGIATGDATFETSAPTWYEWDKGHLSSCRLVANYERDIAGWCALRPVSGRSVYRGVAELSIYISSKYRGNGIGKLLLRRLIEDSENRGMWTLQAGVFPENVASINLHKQAGFRELGTRERIGKMNGVWRDVIILERRSSVVN
ncbi:GNAT family N-acetyltransferase [Radiobacillus sp. PE A8.2]|uniref:GNAT family N-acetyltransferase n=1 Tax=Radiobacillus sp. PE A8.2 TaxID=3380349 RepID=UPI003890642B